MMDARTAAYLKDLNRTFYAHYGTAFDETRQRAWAGWTRLAPHLRPGIRAWDAGCGNGRFARFLASSIPAFSYTGTDSSTALLDSARAALSDLPDVTLAHHDLLTDPLPDAQYDLIALFGVLHHVPGVGRRGELVSALADRLSPGGLLVFTGWRFYEYPRFRAHLVAWDSVQPGFPLMLEPGDHLLDWQGSPTPPRYCHYTDDAEHEALIAASGLARVDDFRADGFDGRLNRYSLLVRN